MLHSAWRHAVLAQRGDILSMKHSIPPHLLRAGLRAANPNLVAADKVWSRHSHDKVNIGETLGNVIRTLHKALPLDEPLRALSIGSSNEPQFRILTAMFRGGVHLLDLDREALGILRERVRRQTTRHVFPHRADFHRLLLDREATTAFARRKLGGRRVHLVTLHHSLYYCPEAEWEVLFRNLHRHVLARRSAVHAVLMASRSANPHTTTWLYNHFAGKFCGHVNDQDLRRFGRRLKAGPAFADVHVSERTDRVTFWVDDFAGFMAVIWMILLYPHVHDYSPAQRRAIVEHVYHTFWRRRQPLIQTQHHLTLYRGIPLQRSP